MRGQLKTVKGTQHIMGKVSRAVCHKRNLVLRALASQRQSILSSMQWATSSDILHLYSPIIIVKLGVLTCLN